MDTGLVGQDGEQSRSEVLRDYEGWVEGSEGRDRALAADGGGGGETTGGGVMTMAGWKRAFARIRSLWGDKRADEELAREVTAHLTLLADDFERHGMAPEEARMAARRAYGGVEQAKQAH